MKFNFKKEILIAILPIFGYIAAYNYEIGYFSSFNLPDTLVQIKIEQFVSFTLLITLLIFSAVGAADFFYAFSHDKDKHPIAHNIIKLTWVPIAGVLLIWYLDIPSMNKFLPLFIGLFVASLTIYILMILFPRGDMKSLSFLDRLRWKEAKTIKQKQPSILDKIPFFQEIATILLAIYAVSFFAQAIGAKSGFDTKKYVVFKFDGREYALIRDYGNKKIATRTSNGNFTNQFLLVESLENIVFSVKDLNHK